MIIKNINPLHIEKKSILSSQGVDFNIYFHSSDNPVENLAELNKVKSPVIFVPSPNLFWYEDFLLQEQKIRNITKNNPNFIYLNNNFADLQLKNKEKYKIFGSIFWNDFNGLNEELVTYALMKSKNFQLISAQTWLDDSKNLEKFYTINEQLKKNNTYYDVHKKYYKSGNFHPIISYLLYIDSVNNMIEQFKKVDIKKIVLSHHCPLDYSMYFNGVQIDLQSQKIYQHLQKRFSLEEHIFSKSSLDITLDNLDINYLFHSFSKKPFSYKYNKTSVFSCNSEEIVFNINERQEIETHKNTIEILINENQKFVKLIKSLIISPENMQFSTKDLSDLIKGYNFLFLLLQKKYWQQINTINLGELKLISPSAFQLSQKEIETNELNPKTLSEKIKLLLNIVSENHFILQKWLKIFE